MKPLTDRSHRGRSIVETPRVAAQVAKRAFVYWNPSHSDDADRVTRDDYRVIFPLALNTHFNNKYR